MTQCTFSNAGVELKGNTYTDPVTGKCMIPFDLYFDLQSNAGGKYIYVHVWPTALYPNLDYVNPPLAANLVNTVMTFGIYHHTTGLYMLETYTPDPSLPNYQFIGLSVKVLPGILPGYDRFKIEGLIIASAEACTIPQSFTADAWESQSAAAQNVHCFSKGLVFYANDPRIIGEFGCAVPREYKFDISTINITTGLTVNYNVYIDVDNDSVYNRAIDSIRVNSGTVTMDASNGYRYSSGSLGYMPYSMQKPYSDYSLWVVVTSAALPNEVYGLVINACIPQPVQLTSFTAARKNELVELKWTTATEINNKGFYIERENGNNNWQQLAYVPSLAANGNSTDILRYQYTDNNQLKEVSQYRILQQDLNGKNVYSEIRMVKGYGQTFGLQVFPNPSVNGNITVVMENAGTETVLQLIDMNGKIVRTWNHVSSNSMQISGINAGMYILRAMQPGMQEAAHVKLLVQ
jgi:hypothetical protein